QQKNMQKNRKDRVPDQDWTEHLAWSPGGKKRLPTAPGCLEEGQGLQDGLKANFTGDLISMRVCVSCVAAKCVWCCVSCCVTIKHDFECSTCAVCRHYKKKVAFKVTLCNNFTLFEVWFYRQLVLVPSSNSF